MTNPLTILGRFASGKRIELSKRLARRCGRLSGQALWRERAYEQVPLFEIGSTLREARMRQGLELRDAERATRIRARYLAALEEERFDQLPAEAYAKGFLRTYADFLGLDADLFVAELNSRFEASRPPPPPSPSGGLSLPTSTCGPPLR